MKNVLINFNIKSLDSSKDFETKGTIDNNTLTFIDDENSKNIISFNEGVVKYIKVGESNMDFTYITNQETKGTYNYLNTAFDFDIYTKSIIISQDLIHIESSLYQDGQIVNESILDIYYQDIKED